MKLLNRLPIAIMVSGLTVASSIAQENDYLKPVVKATSEINQSAADSQGKINSITDQIGQKLQQFKTINKEIDGLNVYNAQLSKQIANQDQEMLDLNKAIDEVSVIERQITL